MSIPGNINPAPPPSSFDGDPKFAEQGFLSQIKTKFAREPLIPFGVGLTCWALVEAMRSMKMRDSVRLNKMFRRRIYAQAFTIAAVVAGGVYWKDDRKKERQYSELSKEKTRQERREAWLKELEARQEEEDELQRIRQEVVQGRQNVLAKTNQLVEKKKEDELRQQQKQQSAFAKKEKGTDAEEALWAQQKIDAYAAQNAKTADTTTTLIRSALELGEGASDRPILSAAMALWRR